jgi:hypothetical protein
MKTKNIIITVVTLFCLCVSACTHQPNDGSVPQYSWEVLLNSRNPFIDQNVDDVSFKFCLLNEQGIPAVRFKEGENFSFRLEMINSGKDELEIFGQMAAELRNDGFSGVTSVEHGTIEFPIGRGLCLEKLQSYPFYGNDKHYQLTIPWNIEQLESMLCGFESLHQPNLPRGQYYTEFTHTFKFRITPATGVNIGPLTFKINFEII